MGTITIVVAANDSYVQHLGTMLYSLFKHNQDITFHTYLLNRDMANENKVLLDSIADRFRNTIRYQHVDAGALSNAKVNEHVTVETYFRLLIPAMLPQEVEKALYLDADMIVKGNIATLWNTDIRDYSLAAIRDVTVSISNPVKPSDKGLYFNAGVMLINVKAWRDGEVMTKCLDFMHRYPEKIRFWDQDALNAVLYDAWLPIHPKYNMQGPLFMDEFDDYYGDSDELQEAIQHPVIIHYSAPQKPWHYLSYHPYTQEYFKYLALTPWQGYRPNDKTFVRVVRKAVRPYLRKAGITKVLGKHLY